jgi:hypothetical protein
MNNMSSIFQSVFYLCNTVVRASKFPYPASNDVLPVTAEERELQTRKQTLIYKLRTWQKIELIHHLNTISTLRTQCTFIVPVV